MKIKIFMIYLYNALISFFRNFYINNKESILKILIFIYIIFIIFILVLVDEPLHALSTDTNENSQNTPEIPNVSIKGSDKSVSSSKNAEICDKDANTSGSKDADTSGNHSKTEQSTQGNVDDDEAGSKNKKRSYKEMLDDGSYKQDKEYTEKTTKDYNETEEKNIKAIEDDYKSKLELEKARLGKLLSDKYITQREYIDELVKFHQNFQQSKPNNGLTANEQIDKKYPGLFNR